MKFAVPFLIEGIWLYGEYQKQSQHQKSLKAMVWIVTTKAKSSFLWKLQIKEVYLDLLKKKAFYLLTKLNLLC